MSSSYAILLICLMHKSKRIIESEIKLFDEARTEGRFEDAKTHRNRMLVHRSRVNRINNQLQAAK